MGKGVFSVRVTVKRRSRGGGQLAIPPATTGHEKKKRFFTSAPRGALPASVCLPRPRLRSARPLRTRWWERYNFPADPRLLVPPARSSSTTPPFVLARSLSVRRGFASEFGLSSPQSAGQLTLSMAARHPRSSGARWNVYVCSFLIQRMGDGGKTLGGRQPPFVIFAWYLAMVSNM
jgi:hypothetical protein